MAFTVNFYNFAKRENSTYRPGGSGASYSCVLKDNSSIANPTIILDLDTDDAPGWNYAYIGEFDRYYYVSDRVFSQQRVELKLSIDVRMSFDFSNCDCIALRSSNKYNMYLDDNEYARLQYNEVYTKPFPTSFSKELNFILLIAG